MDDNSLMLIGLIFAVWVVVLAFVGGGSSSWRP